MNRFHEAEALAATVRAEIPSVAVRWLAAAREPLEVLTTAALDPETSDEEFLNQVAAFIKKLPELMDLLDHDALAELMETGMGAAAGNGIAGRIQSQESRDQKEAFLAGNKNHDRRRTVEIITKELDGSAVHHLK